MANRKNDENQGDNEPFSNSENNNSGTDAQAGCDELDVSGLQARLRTLMAGEKPYVWARRLGIASATFQRLWNEGQPPKLKTLLAVARAYGVTLDWLAAGEGPMLTASARLDEIEGKIDGLSAEEQREVVEELEGVASARDVSNAVRNRARMMLDFLKEQDDGGGEDETGEATPPAASPDLIARADALGQRLAQGAQTYDQAVADIGYTPPEMTGIVLRDAVATGHLAPEKLRHILKAMKYDADG